MGATHGAHSPPRSPRTWLARDARHDLSASLVVFLVAVPLSLGIAVASDAPVLAGLIAAVVGGIVAGLLGGSPLQVSGPAAGLTVVVAGLVAQFGWPVTCAITALAGALQIVLGLTRVGRIALAISPTVVHAMLAGIGATIVLGQVHLLLGGTPGAHAWENLRTLPASVAAMNWRAAAVGTLVIVLLVAVWPRMPARVRLVPGPLVAIIVATLAALPFGAAVSRVDLPDSALSALHLPALPGGQWAAFGLGVLTVTFIASVESLISAVAVDKLHNGVRADLDRELLGQGCANLVSGMLGGLPVTGVILRSSANVRAGARTRLSAVLHGLWIAVFALLLVGLVELVPMAALAGLLIVIGIQLVRIADITAAHRQGELLVYLVTVAGVIALNLLAGVLLGFAVAFLSMVRRLGWARVRVEHHGGSDYTVVVRGKLSFLALPRLSRLLAQVPTGAAVRLELVVDYLDHAAYDHLAAWQRRHETTGGTVTVDEFDEGGDDRWFSSWSAWQARHADIPAQRGSADPLVDGMREYHRRGVPLLRPHLARLSGAQEPQALFLTCVDSRVVPNLITSSGPGDLFTVRNIGNIVPDPVLSGDRSVSSSVQYALDQLKVPTLMVCGHSCCGAMTALHAGAGTDSVGQWLHWARPSLDAWLMGHPLGEQAARDGWSEVDQLAMVNVAVQLDALRTLPSVAEALAENKVRLVGLFYDLRTGTMHMLDTTNPTFIPLG